MSATYSTRSGATTPTRPQPTGILDAFAREWKGRRAIEADGAKLAADERGNTEMAGRAPRPVASLYGAQSVVRPGEGRGFLASVAADAAKQAARRDHAARVLTLEAQATRSARRQATA